MIEYIRINIAKNVNDEFANKLTAPKLIAYNGKMSTKNMLKFKSPEYSCFQICNVCVQIIDDYVMTEVDLSIWTKRTPQQTRNQTTPHKTTNNTTPHSGDKITKKNTKENTNICGNHLFRLREKGKRCREVILGQKWPKTTPPRQVKEK